MSKYVYVGAAGAPANGSGPKMQGAYRLDAASGKWEQMGGGLPANVEVRSIRVQPGSPNIVYVGSQDGVWRSDDAGTTWRHLAPARQGKGGLVDPDPSEEPECAAGRHRGHDRLSQRERRRELYRIEGPRPERRREDELPDTRAADRGGAAEPGRNLRRAGSRRHGAQPRRRQDLGRLQSEPARLHRAAEISQQDRQRHRDRRHDGLARAGGQRRAAGRGVPGQPHGSVPQPGPRQDLEGHGGRPLLAADLCARRADLAAQSEHDVCGAEHRRRRPTPARSIAATIMARPGSASIMASRSTRR